MMNIKKNILLLLLVGIISVSSYGAIYFYNRTDDFSLRYNLWKVGFYPYLPKHIPHAVLADKNRDNLVKGKSTTEIKNMFPNAHEDSITEQQKQYVKELSDANIEYLWLGESNVIIYLENGVGDEISIMKG